MKGRHKSLSTVVYTSTANESSTEKKKGESVKKIQSNNKILSMIYTSNEFDLLNIQKIYPIESHQVMPKTKSLLFSTVSVNPKKQKK